MQNVADKITMCNVADKMTMCDVVKKVPSREKHAKILKAVWFHTKLIERHKHMWIHRRCKDHMGLYGFEMFQFVYDEAVWFRFMGPDEKWQNLEENKRNSWSSW